MPEVRTTKHKGDIEKYGLCWSSLYHPVQIEIEMIRQGGKFATRSGKMVGEGLFYHYKALQKLLWPFKVWHPWNELLLQSFVDSRITGVMGPAASGKTREASDFMLTDYYCFPDCTTVLVSSTELEILQKRAWGEIKRAHKSAKERYDFLPGNLIESKYCIITDERNMGEGRDFRNGLACAPCFPTGTLVDTLAGPRPIETIRAGDFVFNAAGIGRVYETHARLANELVRVYLSDGRTIDCTTEHPFLTNRGWINAIELETLDTVFSARETMQIMREPIAARISEPEVLQFGLPRLFTRKKMRSMQQGISALEPEGLVGWPDDGAFLQSSMRLPVGSQAHRVLPHHDCCMPTMRKDHAQCAFLKNLLLSEMPATHDGDSMRTMRQSFSINKSSHDKTKNSFLQLRLQGKGHRQDVLQEACASNATRDGCVEMFPDINCPLSHQDWIAQEQRQCSLVPNRHRISRAEIGGGNRWRHSSNSRKENQGHEADQNLRGTWVDRVEILESRGDSRFNQSEGGYTVHNIEVEGHPSYSVNGVIVHNCKKGGSFIGLGAYSGIHNKRMRLLADEGQFMPPAYVDAISNLAKAKDFKCIVIGNPKDTTDALGKICEPSAQMGGWDSGIDQTGGTKTWPIRFPNSVCVQLVGTDSPNLKGDLGIELITQDQINADIQFYGTSSLQYMMMDEARMPRGQASRRVLTRRLCERCHALEEPIWKDENQVRIGFLDAAYRGVGGDRCIFGELRFGTGLWETKPLQMLALIDIMVVPIVGGMADEPEHQIADFVKMQCVIRGIVPQNFFFDSTGRGSLMNAFAKYWSPQIVGVEFGGPGTERKVSNEIPVLCKDYYSKFVSELWYSVRLAVESQQIRGFTEEVMNEFCMREWGMTKGNRVEVEPKDKTKLRMGRSPDLADAFCAGLEGARQRGFIIQKLSNNAITAKTDAWKDIVRKRVEALNEGHTLNYAA